jgi:hypothetical protein
MKRIVKSRANRPIGRGAGTKGVIMNAQPSNLATQQLAQDVRNQAESRTDAHRRSANSRFRLAIGRTAKHFGPAFIRAGLAMSPFVVPYTVYLRDLSDDGGRNLSTQPTAA